jgi:hypothetical protein
MISGACLSCGHVRWVWMGFKTVFYLLIILVCIGGFITAATTQMESRFFILSGSVVGFFKFFKLFGDEVLIPISRAKGNHKPDEQ